MKIKYVYIFLLFIFCNLFCFDTNPNIQWQDPDDCEWKVIDSVNSVVVVSRYGKIDTIKPYTHRLRCIDSLKWIGLCVDHSFAPSFILIRKTIDGGKTWDSIRIDTMQTNQRQLLCLEYESDELIFIGCDSGYIWKSSDGGYRWYKKRLHIEGEYGWQGYDIENIKFHGNIGICQMRCHGLYLSEDGGESWEK